MRRLAVLALLALLAVVVPADRAFAQVPSVVISEIFYNPDGQDEGHEFVELLNAGDTFADLSGWSFSSGIEATFAPGTILGAGQRFVVAADATAFEDAFGVRPNTTFAGALSNGGESLTLVDAAGSTIDEVDYDDEPPWPGSPDGDGDSLNLLDATSSDRSATNFAAGSPTPGDVSNPNLTVRFSLERGWYSGDQIVSLTSPTPDAEIRYAIDDTTPSIPYEGPIRVADDGGVGVIRAQAVLDGAVSDIVTHSYVFLPDTGIPMVVTWPSGQPVSAGDRLAISFEFIPPPSVPLQAVGQNAGFRESSGGGAAGNHDKIYFRSAYGAGTFDADLFSDAHYGVAPIARHDQLFLRNWVYGTPISQLVAHDAMLDLGSLSPHGRTVGYYESGSYLGPRHLQERPEGGFMETYTGIDKDAWHAGPVSAPIAGSWSGWDWFVGEIDPDQFIDFHLNQWMANVVDYWASHNWRAAGPSGPGDGGDYRWRFFNWDLDGAYGYNADNRYNYYASRPNTWARGGAYASPRNLFSYVESIPRFRALFADRVQCGMVEPGGALTGPRFLERIDARIDEFDRTPPSALQPVWPGYAYDVGPWRELMQTWIPERNTWLLEQFRADGYLQDRLAVGVSVVDGVLSLSDPNVSGEVWFRLDGGDVRTADGGLDAAAVRYSGPVVLPVGRSSVVARSFDAGQVDALEVFTPACAEVVDVASPAGGVVGEGLVISEVHYNPPTVDEVDGDLREFVEITNTSDASVNLTGFGLEGVGFVFPSGASVGAGERVVLASDAGEFAGVYGFAPDFGYPGRLDDGGERLGLVNAPGQLIDEVVFDDRAPWPESADGGGYSLELIGVGVDNALPASWRASLVEGGSPGQANAPLGDANCDAVAGVVDALLVAQFAVGNRTAASCPLTDPATQIALAAADMNRDGRVDIVDALLATQCVVGIDNDWCAP